MGDILATPVRSAAKGDINRITLDWGNGATQPIKGSLAYADTVASGTAVARGPVGASTPTVGSVTVNTATAVVNNRTCAIGEVTYCLLTLASDQMPGIYYVRVTATTTNGYVMSRDVQINVEYP